MKRPKLNLYNSQDMNGLNEMHTNQHTPAHALSFNGSLSQSSNFQEYLTLEDILQYQNLNDSMLNNNTVNNNTKVLYPFMPFYHENPPWDNFTLKEQSHFLEMELGSPRRHSSGVTISLATYYATLITVGVLGNGLTCFIILTNSYMRTAPNIFLLNLALVDIATLTIGKHFRIFNTFESG